MIDKKKANEVIDFIQQLHLTGDFYGQQFILQPWQREIVSDVYGTVKENGYRQYKYSYLEVAKKQGKTEMTAGLGLYHLSCDGPGGQIYCCASEREQASLVYRAAKQMIEQDSSLDAKEGGILKVVDSKKEIHNLETGTYLKVLSAEAYSKSGINPTVVIFDELHEQRNRDLWDKMTFGAGSARKQPIWWIITTAGDDPDKQSIGWEIHEKAVKILNGSIIEPTWYVKIFSAPEDADIYDEEVWKACNPSLGVTVDIEAIREEAQSAKNSAHVEKTFRWLRLNQWVSLKKISWLPITLWDKTEGDWNIAELLGKRCYVGIDLSYSTDLSAIVCLFPPQKGFDDWRFIIEAYLPENNLADKATKDHAPYETWAKNGYLTTTPGDVIDYGYLKTYIEKINSIYHIDWYCGDPHRLEILKQLFRRDIENKFVKIAQTMDSMTAGMGRLDSLFTAGVEISHPINPLGRWAFGNVIIATDGNFNIKPMKNKSIGRIDPTVALINAMAGAIKLEPKRSIYESRGMRIL